MNEVFTDTGYWVAILDPSDQLHDTATKVTIGLGECLKVTTEMVLVELLNYFTNAGDRKRKMAAYAVTGLYTESDVVVVPQTTEQFARAVHLYASRLDQGWSVTDCASFLLMRQRGITEALAYDHHFRQTGFVALLRTDE